MRMGLGIELFGGVVLPTLCAQDRIEHEGEL